MTTSGVPPCGTWPTLLNPGGLLFVGGDFGPNTRDVQFHRVDRFSSWSDHNRAAAPDDELRVNKRVRSLAMWDAEARAAGCRSLI